MTGLKEMTEETFGDGGARGSVDWPLIDAIESVGVSLTPSQREQITSKLWARLGDGRGERCLQAAGLAERLRAAVTYQYMPMSVRRLLSEAEQVLRARYVAPGDPA